MCERRLLPLLCVVLALGAAASANATTPGPNGRIVFGSAHDSELYSVNADGSELRRLTWTMQAEQSPAWSPDGARIAYERGDDAGGVGIWLMNADGSGQTEIAADDGDRAGDADPAWSPDGTQIAFASTRAGTWNVWLVNVDGGDRRRVSDVFGSDPAWSPDGRQLAYVGTDGIGVVGVDGSNPHVISAPGAFASGPSWSPDGRQIVFSRNNGQGFPGELHVANVDGSGEHKLTSDGFANAQASWSPDGTQIVFQRTNAPPFGWSLWALGVDGTGLRQITSDTNALGPDWGSSQLVPEPSPPDAPIIQISSPWDGGIYLPGMPAIAVYRCGSWVSYVVSCEGDVPSGAEFDSSAGTHTFTVHAVDIAGRTATTTVSYYVPDLVAPQVDLRSPTDGATYDLNADVTIDYACADPNGTGIAYCMGERPTGAPLDTTRAGTHTFYVYAVDNAGNIRQATATYSVVAPPKIQPPLIKITSPADSASYTLGSTPTADYSCWSVGTAQIRTCTGTVANAGAIDTGSVGTKTFTVSASDDNGRTAEMTRTYNVVYSFSGFDPPVSTTGFIDNAKAGDAIPLKFSLQGDKGMSVVTGTTWQLNSCADWSSLGTATTGAGKISYNHTIDRYLDLVATEPSWSGSCRTVDLELADNTHHTIQVRFTR